MIHFKQINHKTLTCISVQNYIYFDQQCHVGLLWVLTPRGSRLSVRSNIHTSVGGPTLKVPLISCYTTSTVTMPQDWSRLQYSNAGIGACSQKQPLKCSWQCIGHIHEPPFSIWVTESDPAPLSIAGRKSSRRSPQLHMKMVIYIYQPPLPSSRQSICPSMLCCFISQSPITTVNFTCDVTAQAVLSVLLCCCGLYYSSSHQEGRLSSVKFNSHRLQRFTVHLPYCICSLSQ